ncbi:hypothetical protein CBM2598_U20030 [Cupriavidus taiwanensis]|nr:hypothetical protein CBM2598_U20030 [Cupriavidus taiwanensis]
MLEPPRAGGPQAGKVLARLPQRQAMVGTGFVVRFVESPGLILPEANRADFPMAFSVQREVVAAVALAFHVGFDPVIPHPDFPDWGVFLRPVAYRRLP